MNLKGAGGTSGGIGSFVLGFLMMCVGLYLLLNAIVVTQPFTLGYGLYSFSMFGGLYAITSGMILLPFVIGVGLIFYNAKNILGWAIAIASLSALIFGVIANIHFAMRPMPLFDLICILVLTVGGAGLFLRSLGHRKTSEKAEENQG